MVQKVDFEAVTNREDWIDQFEAREMNDTLADLSAATITFQVRGKTSKRVHLRADVGNGITIDGPGLFTVSFLVGQMRGLDASQAYDVGCTILRAGRTVSYCIGTVPILDGIVE